jgi:hypothetical protein
MVASFDHGRRVLHSGSAGQGHIRRELREGTGPGHRQELSSVRTAGVVTAAADFPGETTDSPW